MSIKLVALDMDGTLLGADHIHVPPRNVDALRRASAQGVKVVIASGRNAELIKEAAAEIGVVDYAVCANGAGVIDWKTGDWLNHIGLPAPQWQNMLDILHAHGLSAETYADGGAYVTPLDLRGAAGLGFSQDFIDSYAKTVHVVDDVEAAVAGMTVEKIHIFYVPPEKKEELVEELSATGPVVLANAEPTNLEMTAPGADKGTALSRLCAHLGIEAADVMAFGDGDNDLGMLAWAGWSFAMENGSPNTKAVAKYRAGRNDESGVGRAMEEYLLK